MCLLCLKIYHQHNFKEDMVKIQHHLSTNILDNIPIFLVQFTRVLCFSKIHKYNTQAA